MRTIGAPLIRAHRARSPCGLVPEGNRHSAEVLENGLERQPLDICAKSMVGWGFLTLEIQTFVLPDE